jgi:hypothetical protein
VSAKPDPVHDFASDNHAGAHPEVIEAIAAANAGHVGGYGADGWTERAASNPSKPQWPKPDEIVDAWELGTWYLQPAILRLLDYRGQYSSRLGPGRVESDTEPAAGQRAVGRLSI